MKRPPSEQLDLFSTISEGRVTSFTAIEEPELVEVVHPPASGYHPELKAAGTHFFCQGCLSHIDYKMQSKDPRYCEDCSNFLTEEAHKIGSRGALYSPTWVPRSSGDIPIRRHRKHTNGNGELPVKKIKRMAKKGMNSKRIAAELVSQGYEVNYRNIPRIIAS